MRNPKMTSQNELQIIRFKARHTRMIKPDASDAMVEAAQICERSKHAYTACINGEMIGCAGMTIRSQNCAEPWAMFKPEFKARPKTMYSIVKRLLTQAMQDIAPLPAVSMIEPTDTTGRRFLEHLGFKLTDEWVAPQAGLVVYQKG